MLAKSRQLQDALSLLRSYATDTYAESYLGFRQRGGKGMKDLGEIYVQMTKAIAAVEAVADMDRAYLDSRADRAA
jgi:hypothetical protein